MAPPIRWLTWDLCALPVAFVSPEHPARFVATLSAIASSAPVDPA